MRRLRSWTIVLVRERTADSRARRSTRIDSTTPVVIFGTASGLTGESFACCCFRVGLVVLATERSRVRMGLVDLHHVDACFEEEPGDGGGV